MSTELAFARFVHARAARRRGRQLDQLSVQKLAFYAYGALLAEGLDVHVGPVAFAPWKHGPVIVELWQQHRGAGAALLPTPDASEAAYPDAVVRTVDDVVEVYGRLDSWSLRNESHLEAPWVEAFAAQARTIATCALREHFQRKFARGAVRLPHHLASHASSVLDGVPVARFESLRDAADALRRRS